MNNSCRIGYHDECTGLYDDDCECPCHPKLTPTERLKLRNLLKKEEATE